MKVKVKKAFVKDLQKVPTKTRKKIEEFAFHEVPEATSISGLRNVKKIEGHTAYYRARFGNYRIGFEYREGTVVFYRVLDRKDLYKYFP
jgi:mRNA interferase RelE/StbE